MAYQIEFAKSVKAHFEALTASQRSTVLDVVERQLAHEPAKENSGIKVRETLRIGGQEITL